jgi:hypothetical protein
MTEVSYEHGVQIKECADPIESPSRKNSHKSRNRQNQSWIQVERFDTFKGLIT